MRKLTTILALLAVLAGCSVRRDRQRIETAEALLYTNRDAGVGAVGDRILFSAQTDYCGGVCFVGSDDEHTYSGYHGLRSVARMALNTEHKRTSHLSH